MSDRTKFAPRLAGALIAVPVCIALGFSTHAVVTGFCVSLAWAVWALR